MIYCEKCGDELQDDDTCANGCKSSPESACSAAWMRRQADQVERLSRELKYLYYTVDVIEGTQRRILDQLDAVSPVQPTQSASEDWRLSLRGVLLSWKQLESGKTLNTDYVQGFDKGLAVAIRDLEAWIAKRSESNNTSEGSDGSFVG